MKPFLLFLVVFIISSCQKGEDNSNGNTATLPTVVTLGINSITSTSALSGGNVSSDGGANVTTRGVCWGTLQNPLISGNHTIDGTGTGTFSSTITGLTPGTIYYVRAYAINSEGIAYGDNLSFTSLTPTVNLPTVNTAAIASITSSTALSGGNISSDGGAAVIARGICWSTATNPLNTGSHTIDGSGIGSFVSSITGLAPSTVYYLRAYAVNSSGTGYGNELTFTTSPSTTPTSVNICGNVWMTKNLDVTKFRKGDDIPQVTDPTTWLFLTTGAWCYYNNDPSTNALYGKLYNWHAVNDPRGLAPTGWHVPSETEWTTLSNCLGGENLSGGPLKEDGLINWAAPNAGATNSTGFKGLPGGKRANDGAFGALGYYGVFWSSSDWVLYNAKGRFLYYLTPTFLPITPEKIEGLSVRCIKD